MYYTTLANVLNNIDEAILIQLTDDAGNGVVDEDIVNAVGAEVDGQIDSALSKRYTVPLSPIPAVITAIATDMLIWRLYTRREKVEEAREKRNTAAVKFLEAIRDGKATLGVDPEPSGGEQQIKSSRQESDRTFTIGKKSTGESGSLDNY